MRKKLEVESRIITEILSGQLYPNALAVIVEYVSNAWDAESTKITITVPDPMSEDPLIISDNGRGINWDLFFKLGLDKDKHPQKPFRNLNRPSIGTKGIGRWSGFAIANKLKFESYNGSVKTDIAFKRVDIDFLSGDYTINEKQSDKESGTIITISDFTKKFDFPEPEKVMKELLMDFGCAPDFKIIVNEREGKLEDIPNDYLKIIDYQSKEFGLVSGFIAGLTRKPKKQKRKPGVIIRVNNRRVKGPTFLNLDNEMTQKYDQYSLRRIIGEVNVNELKNAIVGLRYDSFDEGNEKYVAFSGWLKEQIEEVARMLPEEKKEDIEQKLKISPEFQSRWRQLESPKKAIVNRIIEPLSVKLGRVRHSPDLLKVIGLLVIRAVENEDLASILIKLENTKNSDIAKLSEVLEKWGIGEVANVSAKVQKRLKLLHAFSNLIHNLDARELQHLHKSLENNLWIIDERLEVFTSNQSFRNIARKIADSASKKASLKRPDLLIKGFVNDYVMLEFKAPNEEIKNTHMTQLLDYRDELENYVENPRGITCYMVGLKYDPNVLKHWGTDNSQHVYCMPLGSMVNKAHERMKWLQVNIEKQLDKDQTLDEILSELGLEKVEVKKT